MVVSWEQRGKQINKGGNQCVGLGESNILSFRSLLSYEEKVFFPACYIIMIPLLNILICQRTRITSNSKESTSNITPLLLVFF